MQERKSSGNSEANTRRTRHPNGATIVQGLMISMPDVLNRALALGLDHPVATREADLRSAWQLVAI